MRLLVTGATGHVGGRLTRLLVAQGHRVIATGAPGSNDSELTGLDCEVRLADLLDAAAVAELVAGVDAVFHVAAMVSFVPALYERQMQVNVEGTRILLDAAREAGVGRLVHTSTVNTLGVPRRGEVGDEDTPNDWAPYRLGYMDSKRASEELVLARGRQWAAKGGGPEVVCVLPGTMFGPGDLNFSAGSYIREAAKGRLLVAPPGGTTVVHVDDVARGHLLALEAGQPGRCYVLGGELLSYAEIYRRINAALGKRGPFAVVPGSLLRWSGALVDGLRDALPPPDSGALGALAQRLDPAWNAGLARAASELLYYRSDRAQRELGYRHRPARLGICEAVDWYRARGLI